MWLRAPDNLRTPSWMDTISLLSFAHAPSPGQPRNSNDGMGNHFIVISCHPLIILMVPPPASPLHPHNNDIMVMIIIVRITTKAMKITKKRQTRANHFSNSCFFPKLSSP